MYPSCMEFIIIFKKKQIHRQPPIPPQSIWSARPHPQPRLRPPPILPLPCAQVRHQIKQCAACHWYAHSRHVNTMKTLKLQFRLQDKQGTRVHGQSTHKLATGTNQLQCLGIFQTGFTRNNVILGLGLGRGFTFHRHLQQRSQSTFNTTKSGTEFSTGSWGHDRTHLDFLLLGWSRYS